jgi:hypothetical protein
MNRNGPAATNATRFVIDWLLDRHRKGMKTAFESLLDDLLPDDDPDAIQRLDREAIDALQINLMEWLLAEGTILVRREPRRIIDHLLGRDGPALTPAQQAWLTQMGRQPLRLYTVTAVRPGMGATLCDALDQDAAPIDVIEAMGSRNMRPGMLLGCRVMREGSQSVLSGAMYRFSDMAGAALRAELQADFEGAQRLPQAPENIVHLQGRRLMKSWLQQFLARPPMPRFVNAGTGDSVLLITDHYRVLDWDALEATLAACPDVQGSRATGWMREAPGGDGQPRVVAALNLGKRANRLEPFYRSQRLADEGRAWLDQLAGASLRWLRRESVDPASILARTPGAILDTPPLPAGPTGPAVDEAIEQAMRRAYADWADQPIPALNDRTPRQAIGTPAGLERVKGLLRGYEDGEARVAAAQGRRAVDYGFLWDTLAIKR